MGPQKLHTRYLGPRSTKDFSGGGGGGGGYGSWRIEHGNGNENKVSFSCSSLIFQNSRSILFAKAVVPSIEN